jgi:hypothetical protein
MEGSRGRRLGRAVGLTAILLVGACGSSSKPKSGISIDTLAAASGTACPVPLEVAADNSGIDTPTPATGSVEVGLAVDDSTPASRTQPGTSPIEAADGVAVRCTLTLADGTPLALLLVAARTDAAPELLIPEVARVGQLSANQATQLANDATRTDEGALVPMPGAGAAAMLRTKVDGAASAALLVSAKSLKRPQVEQVARQLDQRLR